MGRKWIDKERQVLIDKYADTPSKELSKILNKPLFSLYNQANKLGLKKDQEYLKAHVYTIKPNKETQFVKGQKAWNKGMKGLMIGGQATQFAKGHKPHNWKPEGTIRVNAEGYKEIKVGKKYVLLSRHIYSTQVGELKSTDIIRFKDGNRENLDINNLEKISREEHALRNSVHNLPEELKEVVNLKRTISKLITEHGKRQNSRP